MTAKRVRWVMCSVAVGITMFLVGAAFHFLVKNIFPDIERQYENWELFRPWSGWTGTYMLLHPFLYCPIFVAVFLGLRTSTAFPAGLRGGLLYGAGVFSVGSLPVFVLAFASFQVSVEIIGIWVLQNLCQYLAAGIAVGIVADGMTVRVSTELEAPADQVWERLLRKDTFLYLIRGWLGVAETNAWPEILFCEGYVFVMRIRIFNCGPVTAHEVRIVRVDASAKEIETEESGGLVSVWNHRMLVEALPGNRSRYTDCIDLRAGLLTLAVWLFASLFYRVRQRRWIRLLAELAKEESDE